MKHAAKLGRWVWRAPIGYRNVRQVDGIKTIEPDPAKLQVPSIVAPFRPDRHPMKNYKDIDGP